MVRLLEYKQWADGLTCKALLDLPNGELLKPRATTFGNILKTLSHVYAVEDIFKHHLLGVRHNYKIRNIDGVVSIGSLCHSIDEMNQWYLNYAYALEEAGFDDVVRFNFLDGSEGAMTRENVLLHIVNHATYHRGFIGDMLRQIPYQWPSNDFTVFLSHR
ncbi:DinB family protein [Neokomagataea thailandica NBRC 106555]|uniref:DinB family protein n=1 Tax=Neokomagataea thailandica NBRC 106555 TaxID=1223520 RepID=A0ABQ0QMG0_9PROT|nr:DinB family protein [Neokomagataea thailandica NBRC 106555]